VQVTVQIADRDQRRNLGFVAVDQEPFAVEPIHFQNLEIRVCPLMKNKRQDENNEKSSQIQHTHPYPTRTTREARTAVTALRFLTLQVLEHSISL